MAVPSTRAGRVVGEFFSGFATLFRGFGWWRRRADLMLLGLVPALVVAAGLVAVVLLLATFAEGIVAALTPFADTWDPLWATLLRVLLGVALLVGTALLGVVAFTGLTLLVGDWFYERIWRAVETDLGGFERGEAVGFWRAAGDAVRLILRAVLAAAGLALIGLIPVIGTATAAVLGVVVSGRILASELTTRPFEARGLDRDRRRELLRSRRARATGFGIAVQLCFLVPGGAILVMPAAVAGATELARELLPTVREPAAAPRTA